MSRSNMKDVKNSFWGGMAYKAASSIGGALNKSEAAHKVSDTLNNISQKGGAVIDSGISISKWLFSNWQVVAVGAVAIILLIKRL